MTQEDKEAGVLGIHIEVGDNLEFEEVFIIEAMALVQDNNGDFFIVGNIVFDRCLDSLEKPGFFPVRLTAQVDRELSVEFKGGNGGKGDIEGFIEVLVELFDKGSQVQSFTDSGKAGNEHEASFLLHIIQTSEELWSKRGHKDMFGVYVFAKWDIFEIVEGSNHFYPPEKR